ncbi:cache domain-containing protein [Nocardioides sp. CFH 31398]|uniref:cache domain-containing protein n=1 Tax=Nocardioides sp. CFH 31398 TaxID=2919579 RepID=UPI001F0680E4|nr:cache domain-containing protein [Nocardioides sp. CFH 31398]MCH1866902.1 cache domain-containing protein [Nocardioides sp. CFH 31398]
MTSDQATRRTTDPLDTCVTAAEEFLLGVGAAVGGMAAEVARRMGEDGPTGTTRVVTPAGTSALVRPLAESVLGDPRVLGAGFVGDPDALGGVPLLAWWQGEHRTPVTQPVTLGRDADYRSKEWFRATMTEGGLHVTGPYLDYVCSDEFVLTLTTPVVGTEGTVWGLAGADVLAETVERVLAPAFVAAGALLLNRHDQVVVAGAGRAFAGDRLTDDRFDLRRECRGLPLVVAGRSTDDTAH